MLLKRIIPLVATLALLTGLTLQKQSYLTPEDAREYHRLIRTTVAEFPYQIGSWVGEDVDLPPEAVALLRPNAIVSRRFRHEQTGQQVSFLIVQCEEARDMAGHYPPICYPANGWTPQNATDTQWTLDDGAVIAGREYEFAQILPDRTSKLLVNHVFVLPKGGNAQDIERVRDLASDYRRHFYGAGQIQIVFGDHVAARERHDIAQVFLEACRPVMDAISSGDTDG